MRPDTGGRHRAIRLLAIICIIGGANDSHKQIQIRSTPLTPVRRFVRHRGGASIADAASFDGSVVGESPPTGATFGALRWTAAQGMMAVPVGLPNALTDDGTMVAGGNAWWKTSGQRRARHPDIVEHNPWYSAMIAEANRHLVWARCWQTPLDHPGQRGWLPIWHVVPVPMDVRLSRFRRHLPGILWPVGLIATWNR
jgi:hypothetical protein